MIAIAITVRVDFGLSRKIVAIADSVVLFVADADIFG